MPLDPDKLSKVADAVGGLAKRMDAYAGRRADASFEKDLEDNEPRKVTGVKGAQSRPFSKTFRNAAAMEKWMDGDEAGDVDVHRVERAS